MSNFTIWTAGVKAIETEIERDALMQMSLGVSSHTADRNARYKVIPDHEIQLGLWLTEMAHLQAELEAGVGGTEGAALDLSHLDKLRARVQKHLQYAL